MRRILLSRLAGTLLIAVVSFCSGNRVMSQAAKKAGGTKEAYYTSADFDRVEKVDAHCHLNTYLPDFALQAKKDHFRLVSLNLDDVNEPPPMEELQRFALAQQRLFPGIVHYATTFSVRHFSDRGWAEEAIRYLKQSFDSGAVAVKIYKVIGMTLKDSDGKMVMIDDPRFEPVLRFIENCHIPVVGHLGEPKNCWLPVDSMTVAGDKSYYSANPEYHMYLHPGLPSYAAQIAARDRMVAAHPGLTFIGAHLGSLEWSVDELAGRLDAYPNMAVDMAARITHLQYQAMHNRRKVRDFIIKYQDRLLYATDMESFPDSDPVKLKNHLHRVWTRDWDFLVTDQAVVSRDFKGIYRGLKLPKEVVDKIYHGNAERWYPLIKP